MTDTSARNRQSAGQPTGGQFATEAKSADTGVTLSSGPVDHGSWNPPRPGSRSPWGTIDDAVDVAPGIVSVGTPGHGGVKLSPECNRQIPAPLRNSGGWYEEDVEAYVPSAIFSEEFAAERRRSRGAEAEGWGQPDFVRDQSTDRIREWFPDAYEQWTGDTVLPGQSTVRDRETFLREHAEDHLAISAIRSDSNANMVEVTATVGGETDPAKAEQRHYLVPASEYAARGPHAFVVDPARHAEFGERSAPFVPPAGYQMESHASLPKAKQAKVRADLDKRWRDSDGAVKSMQQMIDDGEVTGKSVHLENGRRVYTLDQQTGPATRSTMPVSKETWETFGAPDARTDADRAHEEFRIAEHAMEKLNRSRGGSMLGGWGRPAHETEKTRKAEARLDRAKAKWEATRKEQP